MSLVYMKPYLDKIKLIIINWDQDFNKNDTLRGQERLLQPNICVISGQIDLPIHLHVSVCVDNELSSKKKDTTQKTNKLIFLSQKLKNFKFLICFDIWCLQI